MWNVIWGGTYENKSVNVKFICILSVNILFLFQETSVNKNIQVLEASGRGYMVGIYSYELYMIFLDLRHLNTCFVQFEALYMFLLQK